MTIPNSVELDRAQFRALYDRVSTWGRWGTQDRRGALNYLTSDRVVAALSEVRSGVTVAMSQPVEMTATPDNPEPPVHHMTVLPDVGPDRCGSPWTTSA